jgi:hypothetical protein
VNSPRIHVKNFQAVFVDKRFPIYLSPYKNATRTRMLTMQRGCYVWLLIVGAAIILLVGFHQLSKYQTLMVINPSPVEIR